MKEKEIRLTSQEIDYLLKGTIQWDDILSRQQSSLRKPLDIPNEQEDKWKSWKPEEPEEYEEPVELKGWDFRRKDYQKDNPPSKDFPEGDSRLQDYEEENELPFLSGTKVYLLLSFTACIVLGTWIYFVFA